MDSKLTLEDTEPKYHSTQPPAHYTEASLVKALEELGIGRPGSHSSELQTVYRSALCRKRKEYLMPEREVLESIDAVPDMSMWNLSGNGKYREILEGAVNDKHRCAQRS